MKKIKQKAEVKLSLKSETLRLLDNTLDQSDLKLVVGGMKNLSDVCTNRSTAC